MSTEDRLRAALRDGAPDPLDATAIAASARRRRAVGLARVGAVAAAVVLVAGVGTRVIGGVTSDTAVEPGSALATPAAPAAPAPATAQDSEPPRTFGAERSTDGIPGRALVVTAERWCFVDDEGGDRGQEVACAPRDQRVQRVPDDRGRLWLALLAPSGPRTALLQVEQSRGWMDLRTSHVSGSDDEWLGVVPIDRVPDEPRPLRALDARGEEIWRG